MLELPENPGSTSVYTVNYATMISTSVAPILFQLVEAITKCYSEEQATKKLWHNQGWSPYQYVLLIPFIFKSALMVYTLYVMTIIQVTDLTIQEYRDEEKPS